MVFPQIFFEGYDLETIVGFESCVTKSFYYVTIIGTVFSLVREIDLERLKTYFIYFAFIDSLVMTSKLILTGEPYLLMSNPALDSAFIGCVIPLAFDFSSKNFSKSLSWFVIAVLAAPCIYTRTSTGILALGVSLSIYFLANNNFKRSQIFTAIYLAVTIAWVGYFIQGDKLFQSTGRTHIWELTLIYFAHNVNIWLGHGLGTFKMIGQGLAVAEAVKLGNTGTAIVGWPTLHNDWLQVLFEAGIVGLTLVTGIFLLSLYKSKDKPDIFASLFTFGAISLIQMPIHWTLFACLAAFLLRCSFQDKPFQMNSDISHSDIQLKP